MAPQGTKRFGLKGLLRPLQWLLLALLQADKVARELLAIESRGKHAKIKEIPIPPAAPRSDFSEGSTLQLLQVPEGWLTDEAELCAFCAATKWLPGKAIEGSGTAWIEIYALYRALGGIPS